MKYFFRYFLFLVIFPSHSFSQIITDSSIFYKPSFTLTNNHHDVVFTKIDSIEYTTAKCQNIYANFDTDYIKKTKGLLIIPTKAKIDTFKDDSIEGFEHYCVFKYEGFLTKVRKHIVEVQFWESNMVLFISENDVIDSPIFNHVDITPSLSNKNIAYNSDNGEGADTISYTIGVYQFNDIKNELDNYWSLNFQWIYFQDFKWVSENKLLAIAVFEDKRKIYYEISF